MKTSELIDQTLDWAVAKAQDRLTTYINDIKLPGCSIVDVGIDEDSGLVAYVDGTGRYGAYSPSTDWEQGGPIIEREKIKVDPRKGNWEATIWNEPQIRNPSYGPTPLIAAMRCFVASKLGDEVEIPEELV
jgi:hypothetical protein